MKDVFNTDLLLLHLSSQINLQLDKILKPAGIKFSEYKILLAAEKGFVGQLQFIASRLGQTKPSISRQINRMDNAGLVKIKINPEDRRKHSTSLTHKGRKLLATSDKMVRNYNNSLLTGFSQHEKQILTNSLEKLHMLACKARKCDTILKLN